MEFGTSGYTMDHVFVLYDRASNSVWYPGDEMNLVAVAGQRKGASIPFLDEPAPIALREWLEQHPDSTVLLPTEDDAKMMHRPYLGVGLDAAERGLVITGVAEGSPAAAAGFRPGDLLRRFGGREIAAGRDLRDAIMQYSAGDSVEVVVERDGAPTKLQVKLGSR